nr:membrane steroid-binding protein 1-like [Tanacetum cinerariifolium]
MATQVLETITTYTGLSPTTLLTAVAVSLSIYYVISSLFGDSSSDMQQTRSSSFEEREPLPPPVQLGEVTADELKEYDGTDPKKPLLMAIKGQIYDVSQSRMFYGPGGPYALFAGKDASRALAKMSFEAKDLTGDITGLGLFELDALRDWEYKFMSKYAKVGTIKTPETAPEPSTADQPAESSAAQPAEPIAEFTAAQPAEPALAADEPSENAATIKKEETSTTSEANKDE